MEHQETQSGVPEPAAPAQPTQPSSQAQPIPPPPPQGQLNAAQPPPYQQPQQPQYYQQGNMYLPPPPTAPMHPPPQHQPYPPTYQPPYQPPPQHQPYLSGPTTVMMPVTFAPGMAPYIDPRAVPQNTAYAMQNAGAFPPSHLGTYMPPPAAAHPPMPPPPSYYPGYGQYAPAEQPHGYMLSAGSMPPPHPQQYSHPYYHQQAPQQPPPQQSGGPFYQPIQPSLAAQQSTDGTSQRPSLEPQHQQQLDNAADAGAPLQQPQQHRQHQDEPASLPIAGGTAAVQPETHPGSDLPAPQSATASLPAPPPAAPAAAAADPKLPSLPLEAPDRALGAGSETATPPAAPMNAELLDQDNHEALAGAGSSDLQPTEEQSEVEGSGASGQEIEQQDLNRVNQQRQEQRGEAPAAATAEELDSSEQEHRQEEERENNKESEEEEDDPSGSETRRRRSLRQREIRQKEQDECQKTGKRFRTPVELEALNTKLLNRAPPPSRDTRAIEKLSVKSARLRDGHPSPTQQQGQDHQQDAETFNYGREEDEGSLGYALLQAAAAAPPFPSDPVPSFNLQQRPPAPWQLPLQQPSPGSIPYPGGPISPSHMAQRPPPHFPYFPHDGQHQQQRSHFGGLPVPAEQLPTHPAFGMPSLRPSFGPQMMPPPRPVRPPPMFPFPAQPGAAPMGYNIAAGIAPAAENLLTGSAPFRYFSADADDQNPSFGPGITVPKNLKRRRTTAAAGDSGAAAAAGPPNKALDRNNRSTVVLSGSTGIVAQNGPVWLPRATPPAATPQQRAPGHAVHDTSSWQQQQQQQQKRKKGKRREAEVEELEEITDEEEDVEQEEIPDLQAKKKAGTVGIASGSNTADANRKKRKSSVPVSLSKAVPPSPAPKSAHLLPSSRAAAPPPATASEHDGDKGQLPQEEQGQRQRRPVIQPQRFEPADYMSSGRRTEPSKPRRQVKQPPTLPYQKPPGASYKAPKQYRRATLIASTGAPLVQLEHVLPDAASLQQLKVNAKLERGGVLPSAPRTSAVFEKLQWGPSAAAAAQPPKNALSIDEHIVPMFDMTLTIIDEDDIAWSITYEGHYVLKRQTRVFRFTTGWEGLMRSLRVSAGDKLVLQRWTKDRRVVHLVVEKNDGALPAVVGVDAGGEYAGVD